MDELLNMIVSSIKLDGIRIQLFIQFVLLPMIDNTNGGYIVIGVKEKNGMPVFPLEGLDKEELDSIQQEIFQYCNMIVPRYIPRMEVVDYKNTGVFLIYLWCPAGDSGPY